MNCKVCRNISGKNPNLSFFRFPSDYRRCRDWAERCDILNAFEKHGPVKFYKSFRICSDHFDDGHVSCDGRKRKLTRAAVPRWRTTRRDADESLNMKLMRNLCRLCAEENADLIDIYGRRGRSLELEEKIKVFPIAINKRDKLPLKICERCTVKVSKFHEFVKNCVRAETRLRTILGNEADEKLFLVEGGDDDDGGDERKLLLDGGGARGKRVPEEVGEGLVSRVATPARVATTHKFPRCGVCLKAFPTRDILESHSRAHALEPDDLGRFPCATCDKTFANKYRLNEHMRVHTGECPFRCGICDKSFHKRALLKQHSAVHESRKPFACFLCDFRSSRKGNLVQHLRTHRKDAESKTPPPTGNEFARNDRDVETTREILGDTEAALADAENLISSSGCGGSRSGLAEESSSSSSPRRGKRQERRLYRCEECGVDFKRKDTLKNHTRIHTGERPFVCGSCGFAFKQKGDCLKHERNHRRKE